MRRSLCVLLVTVACVGFPALASAADVSSTALVEEPAVWDGRVVMFTGEAVGEAMVRGDETWLHLNDDAYVDAPIPAGGRPQGYNSGMAVVARTDDAEEITVFGDYRHRGDVVQVSGVFNAACPEHGGDMDIHASSVRVIRAGVPVSEAPSGTSLAMLGAAFIAAAAAIAAYTRRRSSD